MNKTDMLTVYEFAVIGLDKRIFELDFMLHETPDDEIALATVSKYRSYRDDIKETLEAMKKQQTSE